MGKDLGKVGQGMGSAGLKKTLGVIITVPFPAETAL